MKPKKKKKRELTNSENQRFASELCGNQCWEKTTSEFSGVIFQKHYDFRLSKKLVFKSLTAFVFPKCYRREILQKKAGVVAESISWSYDSFAVWQWVSIWFC